MGSQWYLVRRDVMRGPLWAIHATHESRACHCLHVVPASTQKPSLTSVAVRLNNGGGSQAGWLHRCAQQNLAAALSRFIRFPLGDLRPHCPDAGRTSTFSPTSELQLTCQIARLAHCRTPRFPGSPGSPGDVLRNSDEDSSDFGHRQGHCRDAWWRRWQPSRATSNSQRRNSKTRHLFHLPLYPRSQA